MKILANLLQGSRLYGLNTPESDFDRKSIYIPYLRDCILQTVSKTKNDLAKVEDEINLDKDNHTVYSIQYWFTLLYGGQSVAIEMACTPREHWDDRYTNKLWEDIYYCRKEYFSKNMKAFMQFARAQAVKYSTRSERMFIVENVLNILKKEETNAARLFNIWDLLPENEVCKKGVNERNSSEYKRTYSICGKDLQESISLTYAIEVVQKLYNSFGERVRKAKDMGQKDTKSLAHAFRACRQTEQIIEENDLTFPIRDYEWIRDLKIGKMDFIKDNIEEKLNNLIESVEKKLENSSLPDRPNKRLMDQFILRAYLEN
jgi:hypothetical protein